MFFSAKKHVPADKTAIPSVERTPPKAAVVNGKSATGPTTQHIEPSRTKDVSAVQKQQRIAALLSASTAFTQIVTLLMRSPLHKHLSLADLEWLVFPPLLSGQFRIANIGSKKSGAVVPAAVVLWAGVSSEVDKRLSENPKAPVRLRPDEWRSGEIIWLVEAVGEPAVVSKLLLQLNESTFKGREVRLRTREAGSPAFSTLSGLVSKSAQASAPG